jgi:hypothetical protein
MKVGGVFQVVELSEPSGRNFEGRPEFQKEKN